MEKEKVNDDGQPDPENSLDFSEHFNQLELLETHGHLIPTGTQSLWVGNSDEDEEQDEKTEEWYQFQEKKMEKDPSKLLLWAAEKNRLSTVRRLLSEKATHVNTRDEDEYTPLHRAAYSGHLEVVRELIAQGADVHAVTVDGWTPLHSAWKKFLYCEPHKRIKEVLEEELYIKRDECHIKNPPAVALEGIWSIKRNFPVGGLKPGPPSRNTLLPQAKYYSRHGGLRR